MFIWIGAASLLAVAVAVVAVHKAVAMKLLATYYEAEVLEHNGRECEITYRYNIYGEREHAYKGYETDWWKRSSKEEKESKIHNCAKKRALEQSKRWLRTELNDWFDKQATEAAERKEARINGVIDPLRGKMQEAMEDKRMVEAIVQELRNEPQLTEKEKFDKVFAYFETEAKEKK